MNEYHCNPDESGGFADAPIDPIGPLSLAEWEFAYAYRDSLTMGDPEPDSDGFDPVRIAEIRRRVRDKWSNHLARIRGK